MTADRTAELTLLLQAKDLTSKATSAVAGGLDTAAKAAGRLREKMEGLGRGAAVGLGMAAETLLTGGGVVQAATQLGVHMASELVETFGEQAITRFTSSALLATLTAPLAAVGTAIGGFISAAIPVGMALLPVLIIGAIVAAVAVLIFNPEIREKVFRFAGELIGNIVKGLATLAVALFNVWQNAWKLVLTTVTTFVGNVVDFLFKLPGRLVALGGMIVGTIVRGLASLPGKIADVIRDAFQSLKIDIGPFHITASGVRIDLPQFSTDDHVNYHLTGQVPGKAAGGWVGLHGEEIVRVGDGGEPELITPKSKLDAMARGGGGQPIVVVFQVGSKEIARALVPDVSKLMYYDLIREAPSTGPA